MPTLDRRRRRKQRREESLAVFGVCFAFIGAYLLGVLLFQVISWVLK